MSRPPNPPRDALRSSSGAPSGIDGSPDESAALAIERAFFPGETRYDRASVAERAGIEPEIAQRLWRALGLPEIDEGHRFFNEADVEALGRVGTLVSLARALAPGLDLEKTVVPFVRVFGSSIARIAAAEVETVRRAAELSATGTADSSAVDVLGAYVEAMKEAFDFVHRRHLLAAAMRQLSGSVEPERAQERVAVGFADMVGFTVLSQNLSPGELAALVTRFADRAYETVAGEGGRVVKMIGDEVMFVVADVTAAARIALLLAESFGAAGDSPMVRVGLAHGAALHHEGDYFGPVVNLASRLVGAARPGTILVSEAIEETIAACAEFELKQVRPQRLKGVGETRAWVLRRPKDPKADPTPRKRTRRR